MSDAPPMHGNGNEEVVAYWRERAEQAEAASSVASTHLGNVVRRMRDTAPFLASWPMAIRDIEQAKAMLDA